MPETAKYQRRNCIPIIHVKGTHYEVGFNVGRTFKSMIQSFLDINGTLKEVYLPVYETPEGRKCYEATLATVKKNYPQYIEEIQGTADGAEVPFHKLFLLHTDDILPSAAKRRTVDNLSGCSSVCCNHPGQEFLGHNEDALAETLDHFYFVSAHIISKEGRGRWKVKEEKFTSLCYAGTLPGFTMSYNHHGFVYSINLIRVKDMEAGKTPRTILTRALLAAENLSQAEEILIDSGTGVSDGISVNMTFLKQEGSRLFYNAEVGPSEPNAPPGSVVNIITASPGEHIYHCNKFLRLNMTQADGILVASSKHRHATMNSLPIPKCCKDICNILGDDSNKGDPIYRDNGIIQTIATGIFNINKLTWSIYSDNPKTSDPIVELPIII